MATIDIVEIRHAKDEICKKILTQVEHGAQSEKLDNVYSCGQFLNLPESEQRGFHGTAAAIRVLAGYNSTYNNALKKLIQYLENIDSYEDDNEALQRDKNNVIKNAEILYALSYVQSGTANTEELKHRIHQKLINCRNNDGGWAFFTDYTDDSDIYSTALVYLALSRHNYEELENTLNFLTEQLKFYKKEKVPDPTTFSKLCFLVYSLVKLNFHKLNKDNKKLVTEIFVKLWESEHCILNNEFEQNIEYPDRQRHYYVRIPWQLYLLSIASDLSPRYFAKMKSISRINSVLSSILNDKGFIYKHSGKNLSSRTYSILFEVLNNIEGSFKINLAFYLNNLIDAIRSFIGTRIFRNILSFVGTLVVLYVIVCSLNDHSLKVKDITPSIIASLLIISITLGKSK